MCSIELKWERDTSIQRLIDQLASIFGGATDEDGTTLTAVWYTDDRDRIVWFDPVLKVDNVPYLLLAAAEEACELTGVTIVLVGLLRYAERHVGVINVHLVDDRLGR